ncbi:unnamed protein product [Rotaria sp. Silwood2]|nr:unnamed protein product [Rotaria sp. Silwood2]CAF3085645.1 unnamed protein product [Rotaria sp. Silwood2]CAF3954830.1 unnamed protein product [Rotaria sp. Silwood2]CAF4658899.1 unnamed protein product [Rotaria sp. Silwood2]
MFLQIIENKSYLTTYPQIHSIELSSLSRTNEFLSLSFMIDSSFNHLESLVLWDVKSDILMSILIKLLSLSRLQSLTIDMFDASINLTAIYQLVFNLSMLKYYRFSIINTDLSVSLPTATNQQQR